jgi:hypothetical protein
VGVSRAEIISEIPRLSHADRREIMRCIVEAEEDSRTLADCDQRALERFQMLDAMEADDEKNGGNDQGLRQTGGGTAGG